MRLQKYAKTWAAHQAYWHQLPIICQGEVIPSSPHTSHLPKRSKTWSQPHHKRLLRNLWDCTHEISEQRSKLEDRDAPRCSYTFSQALKRVYINGWAHRQENSTHTYQGYNAIQGCLKKRKHVAVPRFTYAHARLRSFPANSKSGDEAQTIFTIVYWPKLRRL